MSRAFTREDDGDGVEVLPDLPQSPNPAYITPAGLAALEARLAALRAEFAALMARKDDMAARLPAAVTARDIRHVEERLRRAIVIDPARQPPGIVAFGAEVTLEDEAGETRTIRIVGEDEADPARGLVTPFSPLGRALIGLRTGETAVWMRPAGRVEVEVTAICFA